MSGHSMKILLVEDNPDHAELVRRSLEQVHSASQLHHVENGEAALDYIFGRGSYADRTRFPSPDLVLLDLRLPRMGGMEVLRHVKSHPLLNRVLVVMLTTSDLERDEAMAYEHHANSFLTKPVDFHRLSQLIKELGLPRPAPEENPPGGEARP